MSLRGLHAHLQQTTRQYQIEDGRVLLWKWRRANEVHAAAIQYLRENNVQSSVDVSVRAIQACQDLVNLSLLRIQDNSLNTQSRYVDSS